MSNIDFTGRIALARRILDSLLSNDRKRIAPMSTGSVDRRVARIRRLLQQALFKLTAEKGYTAVTVEDICRGGSGRQPLDVLYALSR